MTSRRGSRLASLGWRLRRQGALVRDVSIICIWCSFAGERAIIGVGKCDCLLTDERSSQQVFLSILICHLSHGAAFVGAISSKTNERKTVCCELSSCYQMIGMRVSPTLEAHLKPSQIVSNRLKSSQIVSNRLEFISTRLFRIANERRVLGIGCASLSSSHVTQPPHGN